MKRIIYGLFFLMTLQISAKTIDTADKDPFCSYTFTYNGSTINGGSPAQVSSAAQTIRIFITNNGCLPPGGIITFSSNIHTWISPSTATSTYVDVVISENTTGAIRNGGFLGVTPAGGKVRLYIEQAAGSSGGSGSQGYGDYNYIYEEALQVEATDLTYNNVADNQKLRNITFFDGLGRKVQTRAIGASPMGKDIVTHYEYDGLGRMKKEFLPYVSNQNDGHYETGGEAKTITHYNTAQYGYTTNPYTEKRFDNSPLSRVLETGAPGTSWSVDDTSDADHTVKMGYAVNSATDNLHKVRYYQVNTSHNLTNPSPTYYPIGSLYKTITKSENWTPTSGKLHTTEEFINKFGQMILKRSYAKIGSTITPHDTYYVYDVYNNLSFVIPPKVNTADGISTTELNELCYQYKFDKYNRVVEKKFPGKGWEYIVYDKMDRPILTQDAVQRAKPTKEWIFTKYDAYGRIAYTGLYKDNRTRVQVQASADAHMNKYEFQNGLIIAFYDYTNFSYPTNITANDIYTVNYYDNYNFDKAGLSIPSSVYGVISTSSVIGLHTGSKERVLTSTGTHWITTINGYDNNARGIYKASKNSYLNTTETVKTKLDFSGKIIETDTDHTSNITVSVLDKFTYDHVGRLLTQKQTVNSQLEELIVKNTYDELGRLDNKKVGNTEAAPLQTVDFTYNVRGWLTGINDVDNIGTDLFTFKINYNTKDISGGIGYASLYDGNIAETVWRTKSDFVKRGYQYKYDALNRILGSDFRENNSLSSTGSKFDTEYEYDKNGNLENLIRYDVNGTDIDELEYSYATASNKLNGIVDQTANSSGFETFSSNYSYDPNNGNLTGDTGKGITLIEYNYLNLPTKVHFGSSRRIEYVYTASGTKIEKKVVNGFISTTQYAGSFIYENNVLKHFSQREGYVEKSGSNYQYVYQYADHQGNIRLNYTNVGSRTSPSLQIKEENNYYPFGMKHQGYNNVTVGVQNNYKYNGKELQDEVINGKTLQWYDYEARNYDPGIGRFFNIDPLADAPMQMDKSPLAYVWNNPVKMIDPTGMHPEMEEPGEFDCVNGDCSFGFDSSGNFVASSSPKQPKIKDDDVMVAITPDGTMHVTTGRVAKNLMKKGAKWGGYIDSQQLIDYTTYNKSINVETYNCAGLAHRTYDFKSLKQTMAILNAKKIDPKNAKEGDIKHYVWVYTIHIEDVNGNRVSRYINDFHTVAGPLGKNGIDPINVFSKNGKRPVEGPKTAMEFKPEARAQVRTNDRHAKLIVDANGNPVYKVRTNMRLFTFILPKPN